MVEIHELDLPNLFNFIFCIMFGKIKYKTMLILTKLL